MNLLNRHLTPFLALIALTWLFLKLGMDINAY